MFTVSEILKATKGSLISGEKGALIKGISTDTRNINPGEAFIAIRGENFDGHDFIGLAIKKGASCVIYQAGGKRIKKDKATALIKVKDTLKALGGIAAFHRLKFDIPVIAVTGSNGKTTTKDMLAWVLSARFKVLKNLGTKNNQIGVPLTLLRLDSSFDLAVVELGTNHPGEISYLAKVARPNIGIILNIGPSHLRYLRSLKGVFKEKWSLLNNLRAPAIAILNADDDLLRKSLGRPGEANIALGFGIKGKADFFVHDIKSSGASVEFWVNRNNKIKLNTIGPHNIYNALAAISAARIFGRSYQDIAKRLRKFNYPQGRFNLVQLGKLKFIDDTYNANPLSLKTALSALSGLRTKGRKIFIMGDMLELGQDELAFHRQAGLQAMQACDDFIAVGKLSIAAARKAAETRQEGKNVFSCVSSTAARRILFKQVSPTADDIILVKGSRMMKMEKILGARTEKKR